MIRDNIFGDMIQNSKQINSERVKSKKDSMTEGELQLALINDLKKGVDLGLSKPRGSGALTGNADKRKSQAQGGNASSGNDGV